MNRNYEEERSELLIKKSGMPALRAAYFLIWRRGIDNDPNAWYDNDWPVLKWNSN